MTKCLIKCKNQEEVIDAASILAYYEFRVDGIRPFSTKFPSVFAVDTYNKLAKFVQIEEEILKKEGFDKVYSPREFEDKLLNNNSLGI